MAPNLGSAHARASEHLPLPCYINTAIPDLVGADGAEWFSKSPPHGPLLTFPNVKNN